jgi:hypothetical protein
MFFSFEDMSDFRERSMSEMLLACAYKARATCSMVPDDESQGCCVAGNDGTTRRQAAAGVAVAQGVTVRDGGQGTLFGFCTAASQHTT